MSAPGGWLMPEEVEAVRDAIRAKCADVAHLHRRAEEHADYLANRGDRPGFLATSREVAERYAAALATLRSAHAVFEGVQHGAQVLALPSPEEEAAQEAGDEGLMPTDAVFALTSAGRAKVSEALGRPVTDDELSRAGWTVRDA